MEKTEVPDQIWELMKAHLGYTDEEFKKFRADERNATVLAHGPEMVGKTIVMEVVESTGCNSQHTRGTRFYFTGDGNLITKMSPSRVCAFIMSPMAQAVFTMQELLYAGVDPNTMCFKRAGCFDVGVACGGWGKVVMEARMMDRADATALWEADQK